MIGLDDSILVGSKFIKLLLKELRFLVCCGFLVQDENAADVVIVYLHTLC